MVERMTEERFNEIVKYIGPCPGHLLHDHEMRELFAEIRAARQHERELEAENEQLRESMGAGCFEHGCMASALETRMNEAIRELEIRRGQATQSVLTMPAGLPPMGML